MWAITNESSIVALGINFLFVPEHDRLEREERFARCVHRLNIFLVAARRNDITRSAVAKPHSHGIKNRSGLHSGTDIAEIGALIDAGLTHGPLANAHVALAFLRGH
jgi:hypothetical protein